MTRRGKRCGRADTGENAKGQVEGKKVALFVQQTRGHGANGCSDVAREKSDSGRFCVDSHAAVKDRSASERK